MEWQFLVGWSIGIINLVTTLYIYKKQKSDQNFIKTDQYYYTVDFSKKRGKK